MAWRIEKNRIGLYFTTEAAFRPKDEVHPKPWAQLRYSATMVRGKLVDVPHGLGKPYLKYNSFHDDFMEASMITSILMLDHHRRLLFDLPLLDWNLGTVSNEVREAAAKRLKEKKGKLRAENARRVSLGQKPLSDLEVLKRLYGYIG
ncbi:hypothetical protein CYLTODRAFT_421695 [Cylindrobasidium torrendii FP15055 ss-10]|uniref:Uncharacterized protein n=1 Tax=Cylindrobasidium torrendii FP15055 ss-10 TaxID=1314674 RepID=A0A0D7BDW8_9AGAR|nr:hypothetical protein CYLTODRAFT_421695 [Cylindrobasidium torrendii FP15055 ss-10]